MRVEFVDVHRSPSEHGVISVVVRVEQVLQYIYVSVGVLWSEIPPHLPLKGRVLLANAHLIYMGDLLSVMILK